MQLHQELYVAIFQVHQPLASIPHNLCYKFNEKISNTLKDDRWLLLVARTVQRRVPIARVVQHCMILCVPRLRRF